MAGGHGASDPRSSAGSQQPRWLLVAVPVGSIVVAFVVMTIVLLATHHPPGHTFRRLFDTGVRRQAVAERDVHLGDAADLHRALRRGRVPHAALQHRRRGPALRGRDPRRGRGHRARQPLRLAVGPGDDRRRRGRRRGARADPGDAARVPLDQRDHHVADAQLRRRARHQLPDLRLASRTGATRRARRRRCSRRGRTCPTPRAGPCSHVGGARAAVRPAARRRDRGRASGCSTRARGSASRCR